MQDLNHIILWLKQTSIFCNAPYNSDKIDTSVVQMFVIVTVEIKDMSYDFGWLEMAIISLSTV